MPVCSIQRLAREQTPEFVARRWPPGHERPALWRAGALELLDGPLVAIIGTRRPSARGLDSARQWAAAVAGMNAIVVSGAAAGIDTAAHVGALDSGGRTVIVPALGLALWKPSSELARLMEPGSFLLMSNLDPQTTASRSAPVRRNALVAALADLALVIETPMRSGTAYVVRHVRRRGGPLAAVRFRSPVPESAAGNATLFGAGAVAFPEKPTPPSVARLRALMEDAFRDRLRERDSQEDLFSPH